VFDRALAKDERCEERSLLNFYITDSKLH
jgi:hypothetical protein